MRTHTPLLTEHLARSLACVRAWSHTHRPHRTCAATLVAARPRLRLPSSMGAHGQRGPSRGSGEVRVGSEMCTLPLSASSLTQHVSFSLPMCLCPRDGNEPCRAPPHLPVHAASFSHSTLLFHFDPASPVRAFISDHLQLSPIFSFHLFRRLSCVSGITTCRRSLCATSFGTR
jgi:hypothetical protein